MFFQLGANVESGYVSPSLVRAIPKSIPAPATLAQSMVPSHFETSTPRESGPPVGPCGSGNGPSDVLAGGRAGARGALGAAGVREALVLGAAVVPPDREPEVPQPTTRRATPP